MDKTKKVRFELKLTEEEKQKLKIAAAKNSMPANKYVMHLVEKDLKSDEGEED